MVPTDTPTTYLALRQNIGENVRSKNAVAAVVRHKTIPVKGFGRTEVNLLLLKRLHVPQLQVSVREAHCHLVGPGDVLQGGALGPTGPTELQTQVSALPAAGFPQPGDVC